MQTWRRLVAVVKTLPAECQVSTAKAICIEFAWDLTQFMAEVSK